MELKTIITFTFLWIFLSACNEQMQMQSSMDITGEKTRGVDISSRLYVHPEVDWGALDDHIQKIQACQIPEGILHDLSTSELVELLAEYPLLLDAYAYNSIQFGLDRVLANYNGAQELLRRDDNIESMTNFLSRQVSIMSKTGESNIEEKALQSLIITLMEFTACREEMMSKATPDLLEELNKIGGKSLLAELEDPDIYGTLSQGSSMLLMLKSESKISKKSSMHSPVVEDFLSTGQFETYDQYQEVLNYCKSTILKQ